MKLGKNIASSRNINESSKNPMNIQYTTFVIRVVRFVYKFHILSVTIIIRQR